MQLSGVVFLAVTLFLASVGAIDPRWGPILALENVTHMTTARGSGGTTIIVNFQDRPYVNQEFLGCDNLSLDGVALPATLQRLSLINLQAIPEGFEFPDSLISVDLSGNELKTISSSIKWPAHLSTLFLRYNKIQSIDERTTWPSTLNQLDLSYNQLTTVPATKWPASLTEFSLSGNPLVDVTSYASWPPSLARLRLDASKLTRYPKNLPKNLVYINLSNNPLKVFPTRSQLPDSIQSLDLTEANLTSLPTLIAWPNLQQLRAAKNAITSIPEFFTLATKDFHLDLSQNRISKLPITTAWLTDLNALILRNNQITCIEFGTVFPSYVDLQNNKITSLKYIGLPNSFLFGGNPLQVLSHVTLPTNRPLWVSSQETKLKEFTLTTDNYQRFANRDNAYFYPLFSTDKASIEASCSLEYGKVTRYSDTISVCVV